MKLTFSQLASFLINSRDALVPRFLFAGMSFAVAEEENTVELKN